MMYQRERREKMFCRNCGKELTSAPEFCMNCGARPMAGTSFCPGCGAPTTPLTEIFVRCGARVAKELSGDISPKSRLAATLLAWFLGIFGAHRFYVGETGTAIVMLVLGIAGFTTLWLFVGTVFLVAVGIWAFVDFMFAVTGHMKDREGKLIQKW
jgi:TM2 domain-containing membrane protein YozV